MFRGLILKFDINSEIYPDLPQTAIIPRIATIVGIIKGAPIIVRINLRPLKFRKKSARAVGIAINTDIVAETMAWLTVKRIIDQSEELNVVLISAFNHKTNTVPKVNSSNSANALLPNIRCISFIG